MLSLLFLLKLILNLNLTQFIYICVLVCASRPECQGDYQFSYHHRELGSSNIPFKRQLNSLILGESVADTLLKIMDEHTMYNLKS